MADLGASQATIERCLDELQRNGRVRREPGRGVFVIGTEKRSNLIGVYTDGERSPYPNALFLEGVRSLAKDAGFHVADFGPKNEFESQQSLLSTMCNMGFDGIIAALSTLGFLRIEEDKSLLGFINELSIPIVTTRPFASISADSVTPDYYPAFHTLGRRLRECAKEPILFLGHQGLPSLARMYGLQSGLGENRDFRFEILQGVGDGAFTRVAELKSQGWKGTLVVGVPPAQPGVVSVFDHAPWSAASDYQLAVTLEAGQQLPEGVCAHVVYRPSRKLGEVAAGLLIRRIQGWTGPKCHEVVQHEILLR
jgi:DNA-binding LacI/PurR family transcriptional regulator